MIRLSADVLRARLALTYMTKEEPRAIQRGSTRVRRKESAMFEARGNETEATIQMTTRRDSWK